MGSLPSATMKHALLLAAAVAAAAAYDNDHAWLLDDLFQDQRYDANVIPMSENQDETEWRAVNLGLGLTIRNMDLDEAGSLTANCWMKATWNDWRLTWNPEDYSPPIKKIVIPSSMIWRPDISVYNQESYGSRDPDSQLRNTDYNAVVMSDGTVIWIPAIRVKVDCSRKSEDVMTMEDPAAAQHCHIMMGSWTHDANQINITTFSFDGRGGGEKLDLSDFSLNSRYVVSSQEETSIHTKKYECCPEPYMHVDWRFQVQRAYHIDNGKKVYDMAPKKVKKLIMSQEKNEDKFFD